MIAGIRLPTAGNTSIAVHEAARFPVSQQWYSLVPAEGEAGGDRCANHSEEKQPWGCISDL